MKCQTHSPRWFLGRAFVSIALIVGGVTVAPPLAWANNRPGICQGGSFTATPPSGSAVAPGKTITYRLDIVVVGDAPVLDCARNVRTSSLLNFVSAAPDGAYWPTATDGPVAAVTFTGPFDPGTRLRGQLVMRVAADAPAGAVIVSSSGDVIESIVKG
jgi:hypothetical protein